jgi:hypothetical protein
MKEFFKTYAKAATASVGAAVVGLGYAMQDGALTVPEVIGAAGAALVFGFAAWKAPYQPEMKR